MTRMRQTHPSTFMAYAQMSRNLPLRATALLLCALVAACGTTTPALSPAEATPASPRVKYSAFYADGSYVKDTPAEVMVISRATTGNAVGAQILLNVAMLALGGGFGVQPFGKDELKGAPITGVIDRERVRNPVSTDFIASLQQRVDTRLASQPELASRHFKHPIVVGGGRVSLVYESLSETEQERFQLRTKLDVYKHRETAGLLSLQPQVHVACSDASTPALPMREWTANDHARVRQTLEPMPSAALDSGPWT